MQVTSTVPNASFNLTVEPQGPALLYAGSGSFFWGGGMNNQWASPNSRVSCTVLVDIKEADVIPGKSVTWMDRQVGTGLEYNGWHWFNIILENGLNLGVWSAKPINGRQHFSSFASVQFPDGHQEVHLLDVDIHVAKPWTSKVTNLTYYAELQLNLPTMQTNINVTIPAKGAGNDHRE